MHPQKIQKAIFLSICVVLLLPILILPPSFQPSDWTRTILLRIALTCLACFVFFRCFIKKDFDISLPKWNLAKYIPLILLLGFLLSVAISTIFSQDPRFSFFGSPARAGGLLNLLFYVFFAIFLFLFIKQNTWEKLWRINLITATIASLFAIVQSFNILKDVFVSYEGGSAPSFLGNSTFLAIYIFFNAIWTLNIFLQKKSVKQKTLYGVLFLLFILTIFLTGSRATYLAIIASLLFFFFFYPFKIKALKILKISAVSLLAFAVIVVAIFNLFPNLGEKNKLFSRLENRLSIERIAEDLFGTRFAVWDITLKAIKEKPLFGWGPENFYIGFEKYYEPTAGGLQRLWWDRPHNIFLDIIVNNGILSLILYIGFWFFLLWSLQRFKTKETNPQNIYSAHTLQAIFIGYLVALFFNFDSFPTYLISFFAIGYSLYLIFSQDQFEDSKTDKTQNIQQNKFATAIWVVLCVVVALFLFFWNIKPLYLNESIAYSKNLSNIKHCKDALSISKSTTKSPGILKVYSALIYSDVVKKCSDETNQIENANTAIELLKKASVIQPNYTRTWLFMGGFVNVLAAREENPDNRNALLNTARDYLNTALKLSPKRQEILIELEKSYLVEKDYSSMAEIAQKCIDIDPNLGICYWYLGIAEIFSGDQVNGKKNIEESLKKGGFPPQYIQLGVAYISQKNYVDAAEAYRLLTGDYPDNASYHAVYAFLLKEIGDYTGASSQALKVFQLQPENSESLQFLQLLLGLSPNNPVVHSSLAFVYSEIGQQEKAVQELNTAKNIYLNLISRDYNNSGYHYQLAGVLAELGDYDGAYKEALITIKIIESSPSSYYTKEQVEKFIQTLPSWEFWDRYLRQLQK